jgi:ethanolamine utilization microcompartment shell protein EutL
MATQLWRWKFALDLANRAIDGTSFPAGKLTRAAGGETALAAHLLGRTPSPEEMAAATASGAPLALLLASPAFQTF